jgi:preprotein translocase subunit SecE
MAKQAVAGGTAKPGPIQWLRTFYQEVRAEMSKVAWPSRDEIKSSTQITMIILAIFAVIIYVFDLIFKYAVLFLLQWTA